MMAIQVSEYQLSIGVYKHWHDILYVYYTQKSIFHTIYAYMIEQCKYVAESTCNSVLYIAGVYGYNIHIVTVGMVA